MDKKYILTKQGLTDLKKDLHERITSIRKSIADKIEEATRSGDLSENAMYSAALDDQQMNETKIMEITDLVQNAIVNSPRKDGKVDVGEIVEVLEISTNKKYEYQLVGEEEADPLENRISITSPIGEALLHCKVGETVEISLPSGVKSYKILKIGK